MSGVQQTRGRGEHLGENWRKLPSGHAPGATPPGAMGGSVAWDQSRAGSGLIFEK